MKIHEYQAKEILKAYKIPVPKGNVATTPTEACKIAEELGGTVVVKAQIHAGGRGKGGGVKLAHTPAEATKAAEEIIGMTLITHQTGPEGRLVKRVLVEEGMKIVKELYLGIVIDRASASPVIMASEAGGMDIEEIAETSPEKIIKETIDISVGIMPYQVRRMAFALNIKKEIFKDFSLLLTNLYKTFIEMDCSIAEINPLVITDNGRVLALDAKMDFDDNAQYRHKELIDLRDFDEEEPLEVEASRHRLNYIKLDGNIGCMVNGAGLAMGTMDIIKLAGGEPANFLDVGGGANEEMVENAFKILMKDKNVKAVFINIFGGILRCDVLAKGVKQAVENIKVSVPVIVRMEGTNFEEGKEILKSADFNFIIASGMMDGAQKAVATLKTGNR